MLQEYQSELAVKTKLKMQSLENIKLLKNQLPFSPQSSQKLLSKRDPPDKPPKSQINMLKDLTHQKQALIDSKSQTQVLIKTQSKAG
jgi:hypothetical protein